ncbi:MAG: 2,3-bisphosphoglycerate-independent phosphoglycerate mutase [Bacteroidota bacterium]
MKTQKVVLIIMDGWGLAVDLEVSAIKAAHTPFYDHAVQENPFTRLEASGLAVGLPEGQMGNSEVGHMNIGAGRVVYQMLVKVNRELESGAIANKPAFQKLISYCKSTQKPLHLLGLLSDGGVHSHIDHLKGLIHLLAQEEEFPPVYLHMFMDGRDTDPNGGKDYLKDIESYLEAEGCGKIATVVGRYFAMDRDKRWERVKKAYDLLVHGTGSATSDVTAAVAASYNAGTTDEFIEPICVHENGKPVATIQEGDAVLFFNFRTDRGRQLTQALHQEAFPEQGMNPLDLHYCTMTQYDDSFQGVSVVYEPSHIDNGMGEYLASLGKQQIRIAETEKYPHVTFFFNGGREEPFEGEKRILCPSPKVATYDLQPEMSAAEIRDNIVRELEKGEVDYVCLNFANPDMVGHTGVFEAAVKACETVDACTQAVAEAAVSNGYKVLITADHGNADKMRNPDSSPNTAHTTALVPLILLDPEGKYTFKKDHIGKLGDLSPTSLHLMGIPVPEEMTGDILVEALTREPEGTH